MTDQSVLQGPLYSAAEIAAMKLAGLPGSKAAVIARANAEGWRYEERKGLGGTKRMYALPDEYQRALYRSLGQEPGQVFFPVKVPAPAPVIGTIVSGSSKVDPVKLELVFRALSEFEAERGIKVSDERRPAVIAILYDYLQSAPELQDGEKAMGVVLRALG